MTRLLGFVLVAVTMSVTPTWADTKFILINGDGPNEGLNDASPRTPIGGNPGHTLGAQRRYAMLFAAQLLASRIVSHVPIQVKVEFNPLSCDADTAQLGGAGPVQLINFDQAPPPRARGNIYYPAALANALAGHDTAPNNPDIAAKFNSNLDNDSVLGGIILPCLGNTRWYYGFDHNPPADALNFVATAVHELLHGLGFASFSNLRTGKLFHQQMPDIYTFFIRDQAKGATWPNLTPRQRARSATNAPFVVWTGSLTTSSGATFISDGTRLGQIRLYAPTRLEEGSSISHWGTTVAPNDLMEPFATEDVVASNGIGLASCVLYDIGWRLASGVACPDKHSPALAGGLACMNGICGIPTSGAGNGGSASCGDSNGNPTQTNGDHAVAPEGPGTTNPVSNGFAPRPGSGGGCTLALGGGTPDPSWLLLAVLAWCLRLRGQTKGR